jgi:transmembrane sensor
MSHLTEKPYDFSDFLMDDELIERINAMENPMDYVNYVNDLKKIYPDQAVSIDLALEVFLVMKNTHSETSNIEKQKIWNKIVAEKAGKKRMLFLSIATSVLLLVGLSGSIFYFTFRNQQPAIDDFAKTTQPTFDKSHLILSDGQKIMIPDYESKIAYSINGTNVIINDTTHIVQKASSENFNQMIVPYGSYNNLLLSDGTKVWINSGSRLVYPPAFSGRTREVYLEGEAYFEVSSDAAKPFYVKTDRIRVEVKGTKFNVLADAKEALYSALLFEGEVSLTSGDSKSSFGTETKLIPGHIATLNDDGRNFNILSVDHPENFIAWKNGYLMFNDEPLNELLNRVSRYYNIEIDRRNYSRPMNISGKLDLKEDPERVLRGIAAISDCKLFIEGGKYILN